MKIFHAFPGTHYILREATQISKLFRAESCPFINHLIQFFKINHFLSRVPSREQHHSMAKYFVKFENVLHANKADALHNAFSVITKLIQAYSSGTALD